MSQLVQKAFYLATEDNIPLTTEDGKFFGYLLEVFIEASKDANFTNKFNPVYENFRQRQEVKLAANISRAGFGSPKVNAGVLEEIRATESFFKLGQVNVTAGGAFLMKTLKTLHEVGAVDAKGLKDIADDELLALLESLL